MPVLVFDKTLWAKPGPQKTPPASLDRSKAGNLFRKGPYLKKPCPFLDDKNRDVSGQEKDIGELKFVW